MSLILAIEPDRRQASKVSALALTLGVELVIGASTEDALATLGTRVPDLVLTSQLLAPKDEAALSERLKALDAAGAHAQTLVIPVLGAEEREQKRKGGLFDRLRRTSQDHATGDTEGCDPAVFGKEIMDYLERSAAERAALAAAQADLEAAWADTPVPDPSSVASGPQLPNAVQEFPAEHTLSGGTPHSAIDVHPDMVIEDPHALFGEFAAIPIRRPDAVPFATRASEPTISFVHSSSDAFDEDLPPATPPWTPPPGAATDEDWEEIALDPDGSRAQVLTGSSEHAEVVAHHHMDVTSDSMDLDAFVRELHTVESTANAQPMIPVVDLSHVVASAVTGHPVSDELQGFLPEPEPVTEVELVQEARATFEAEVAAAFGGRPSAEPAIVARSPLDGIELAFTSEFDLRSSASFDHTRDAGAEPTTAQTVDEPVMTVPDSPTSNPIDVALAAFDPPLDAVQRARTWEPSPESWRTELDALPPPPVQAAPAVDATPREPVLGAAWGDVLSAIQRDIDQTRATDEPPVASPKSKPDVSAAPLVFPTRSVAASVIAAIESGAADRARPEPVAPPPPAPDVAQPDRALAALLEKVSTSESLRAKPAFEEPLATPTALTPTNAPLTALTPPIAPFEPSASMTSPEPDPGASVETAWAHGLDEIAEPAISVAVEASVTPREPEIAVTETVTAVTDTGTAPAPFEASLSAESQRSAEEGYAAVAPDPLAWLTATVVPAPGPVVEEQPVREVAKQEAAVAAVAAASVARLNVARPPKSKKKRRHQKPEMPPAPSQVAPLTIADWGFFDPQRAGFGPLVERLNQLSAGAEAFR